MIKEVASPIDLRQPEDALEWQNTANLKRPYRQEFFDFYAQAIAKHFPAQVQVLELGSGPGFLAQHLLTQLPEMDYTAFDFSQAMHDLSRQKLSVTQLARAKFVVGDFKQHNWQAGLDKYDVIIIHQALHELRHKDYATDFHGKIKALMKQGACYFVCDHLCAADAMQNDQLYMTQQEHFMALQTAGFQKINIELKINGLCLFAIR